MEYVLMEPPIIMESFETLSKKETKILFDWFVNQIPLRIEVLKNVTNGEVDFNFTPESLIDIYSWFLSQVEIYELSEEEIGKELEELRQYPDFIYEDEKKSLLANPIEIAKVDYAIAMDIGIYYAEVIRRNHPQVEWTYFTKPKTYAYLNKPILHFEEGDSIYYEREPIDLMFILNQRIKKGEVTERTLYEMYFTDENLILGADEDPEDED
ncbi:MULTISPECIES: hypothetical protein [Bacillus]|uniref:hypothetical protein n=1 Tax=Bacillus TaxID=1386 RepID=UPI0009756456|nr:MULTISPECIES: hypothetical protein [Bacillus]MBG9819595.1 hypothetical protein [Bacillus safensis]OMP28903.1 hypothetical protein BAE31_01955 [Bacillus sp. I-2]